MWVDVSGRHQPGDGATRAEPVAQSLFSRPREKRPPGGTAGTSWWLGCSCHPMQLALQLARPSRPNSVHKCPKTARRGHFGQSVYTPDFPAPVRNGATAQQCTQMPQSGAEKPDPPICVHYCDPKATHNPSPRPNSVHKCPNPARRGRFSQSVYTPASPWPLTRPGGATGSTTSTAPWSRDARALGPEVHAAGAVTHPSTRAHDASYIMQFFAQFNVTKHNSA